MDRILAKDIISLLESIDRKLSKLCGEDSRGIIVNGVMYDSWEDYRKVQSIKRKEQK